MRSAPAAHRAAVPVGKPRPASQFGKRGTRDVFVFAWFFLSAVLLALAIYLSLALYADHQTILREETMRLKTQVNVIDENIINQFSGFYRVLGDLRDEVLRDWESGNRAQVFRELSTFADSIQGLRALGIYDSRGNLLASNLVGSVGLNFATREFFAVPAQSRRENAIYLSPPFMTQYGFATLNVSRVILGPGGVFEGIVSATLKAEYFETLLDSVRFAPDMVVSLTHSDGVNFFTIPFRNQSQERDSQAVESLFPRHMASGNKVDVYMGRFDHGTKQQLVVDQTIYSNDLPLDKTFVVSISRDLDSVFATWSRQVRSSALTYGLIVIVAVLSLIVFQRRQRRYESAAEENAELLKLASDTAGVGVWEYEIKSGRLLWQEGMAAQYGIAPEDFPRSREDWKPYVLPEDRDALEPKFQAAIRGESDYHVTFRIRRKDGEIRILRSTGRLFAGAGMSARIVGMSFDLTHELEGERMLKSLNDQLKRRTQEAEESNLAKSRFLANVSHEIRTPMNAIIGLLELLKRTDMNSRQSEFVGMAKSSARTLLALLNDILDFSKAEAGKITLEYTEFSLDSLLRNLSLILGPMLASKDIEVLFDLAPDIPSRLIGDPLRLYQILLNLAGNAVKFTERGEVTVGVEVRDRGEHRVSLRFSVRDTGIGISPEMVPKIFQGFQQAEASTTRRYGGTGLGLSISKNLVELMGGRLEVESEAGKGTSFAFIIQTSFVPETEARARGKAIKLLIVDPDAAFRDTYSRAATHWSWRTETASDPGQAVAAVAAAQKGSEPFDFVLLGGLKNGPESAGTVGDILKGAEPSKPFVIALAPPSEQIELDRICEEYSEQIAGFLSKPLVPSMLRELVEKSTGAGANSGQGALIVRGKSLSGFRILVVEDNKTNQLVARELIGGEGAELSLADGAREALAQMAAGRFDAVLMDIQMPDIDGYEATRMIRERFGRDTPIIAMTANTLDGERERCIEAGMNDYVSKPIDLSVLRKILLDHISGEFDFSAAIRRLDSNREIFNVVAHDFMERQADFLARVKDMLDSRSVQDATRELHTLKGQAATLGAEGLARQAQALERSLDGGNGSPDFSILEETLNRAFAALRTELAR